MIVTCPSCRNKYSVQAEAIGSGKLVRCVMCGATWQQMVIPESKEHRTHIIEAIKWTFFWSVVFVSLGFLLFAKGLAIKVWPPVAGLYEILGMAPANQIKALKMANVSNFFVKKDGKLMIGLKGELINMSNEVQILPSITISLRDDDTIIKNNINGTSKDSKNNNSGNRNKMLRGAHFKKIWTHDMQYKKILPNQRVAFETELQSVPYNDLICDIKLDVL